MATPEFLVWARDVGYRGNDIHLVRSHTIEVSSSDQLQSFLRFKMDDDSIAPLPGGTKVDWSVSVPKPGDFGDGTDTYANRYGFDPNFSNGSVTLLTTATSRVIHNFYILASVKVTGVTDPLTARIRVHIHEGRDKVRLQPNPLRIRKGTALRFTVLVKFDDASIGDVSFHPGLTWQPSNSLVVGADPHSSTADGERAFQDGGFVSPAPGTTATSGTVKVNLPDSLGGATAADEGKADITIIEGWDSLPPLPDGSNPYQAQFLGGGQGGQQGIAKITSPQVRNVLFLPEGFQETEEAVFEQMSEQLAKAMRGQSAFFPYDTLGFNFFRLWVQPYDDAKRSGVTDLQELFPETPDGQTTESPPQPLFRASNVPFPHKVDPGYLTPLTSTEKSDHDRAVDVISQLVYLVGLPVSLEPQSDFATQVAEWNRIYQADYIKFDTNFTKKHPAVAPASVARWKQFQSREVTLEIDTLFQLATGGRPNADEEQVLRLVDMHPLRYTREDLDPLLSKLFVVDEKGNQTSLGSVWVDFGSKDVNLVCFILRGQHYSGTSWTSGKLSPAQPNKKRFQRRACGAAWEEKTEPLFQEIFDNGFPATVVGPVPSDDTGTIKPTSMHLAVVAHELTHSILCGDEYGSAGADASDADRVDIDGFWNLQHVKDVGGGDTGDAVEVGAIRWRWPRITVAGVMASALKGSGTTFTVDMLPGHSGLFAKDDQVRYRPAALLTRPTPGDILQFKQPVALFKVTDRVKNTLTLTLVDPSSFNNDSAAGNILYKPTRNSGSDELIIHPAILALLGSSGVLSRTVDTCDSKTGTDNDEQNPKRTLPSGLRYPATKSSIIGLYDGGLNKRCGVYHATGKCLMRKQTWVFKPKATAKKKPGATPNVSVPPPPMVTPLCHVCRYILIDLIDPRRHDSLDRRFKAITPIKTP